MMNMRTPYHQVRISLVSALLACLWLCLATMLFGATCQSAADPFVTEPDMLKWYNSMLPADTYVGVHAERWDTTTQSWKAVLQTYQPFKTMVEPALHEIYWRKDVLDRDFYGELYTYDDNSIYLHAETFPKWPGDPKWDARYDRFRLFVNRAFDPLNYGIGRILAPRTITARWHVSQHFNTYLINSMEENNTHTGRLWQNNFYDNDVFITVERPFSTVYDGEMPGWPADKEFKTFDEAVIINQQMQNNAGRERFIFARKGGTFYGIVRWDSSRLVNGQWKVISRTMGLTLRKQTPKFSFDGFQRRAREDNFIAPFPAEH